MEFDFLAGTWVYRSFRNLPAVLPEIDPNQNSKDDLTKWSTYLFGQGEMELHPGYSGNFSGTFVMAPGQEMDLAGRMIQEGGSVALTWNAVGRPGRDSDGWIYEYRGTLQPNWANGRRQTDAILGTVVRTIAHDDLAPRATLDRIAPAGSVVSFIMVRKPFVAARDAIPLPLPVLAELASRHHRLHHHVWHLTRDHWTSLTSDQQAAVEKLGWKPPRPTQFPVRGTVAEREPDNGAGEDFLYMHRNMIYEVRKMLAANGLPPIAGWSELPKPSRSSDNSDGFSVPPGWTHATDSASKALALIKSDEYMLTHLSFLERRLKDPAYLGTLTLDQLGAKIESQIHNLMHIRWSSLPVDPANPGVPVPEGRDDFDIADKWVSFTGPDGGTYYHDDLNDTFASHVNPIFWRLHGWIDDRVEDWARAHGDDVARKDVGGVPWFETGRWVAVSDPWISGTDHRAMPQVVEIMSGRAKVGDHAFPQWATERFVVSYQDDHNEGVQVEVIAEGEGRIVVLLPSSGRDSEDFDDVASGIAAEGFRVLRPQPRGIGQSKGRMENLTLHDFAREMAEVIIHEQKSTAKPETQGAAVIVGHAYGNEVARMTAVDFPDLVRGVVLAAAEAKKRASPQLGPALQTSSDQSQPDEDRLRALRFAFFASGHDPSRWLLGWHDATMKAQHDALSHTNPNDWWAAGSAPILDLQAGLDPWRPRITKNDLQHELGDRVRVVVIPDASHALIPEQPVAVVSAIVSWLRQLA